MINTFIILVDSLCINRHTVWLVYCQAGLDFGCKIDPHILNFHSPSLFSLLCLIAYNSNFTTVATQINQENYTIFDEKHTA